MSKVSNPRNVGSSTQARVMRRPGKEGVLPTKNTRPWSGGVDKIPQYSHNATQRRPQGQSTSRLMKKSPQEFARVMKTSHPVCDDIINKADTRYGQLEASLAQQENEAADERLKLNNIIQQVSTEKQRAFDEVRRLRVETSRLRKELDEVHSNTQDHVSRTDLNDILKELHSLSSSLANNIAKKMNESDYAFLSTCLPGADLDETNWEGQEEDFGLVNNALLVEDPVSMMPGTDAEDLSCIAPYATMN